MLSWLRSLFSGKAGPKPQGGGRGGGRVKGTYDAAAVTDENARHWRHTDALSARRANSPAVRKILRERSRYETDNNSYAQGILQTIANNLVGSGPTLQVTWGSDEANRQIEGHWKLWSTAIRLADKLRVLAKSKKRDGEGVGLLITNPAVPGPVQLDLHLAEAEQMTTPFLSPIDPLSVDGITFDDSGNPVTYHFLRYHPGDWAMAAHETRQVERRYVVHWFRCDRPGQVRGIPEFTPCLGLFQALRRFTLATITAAETAASFAAVLETTDGASRTDDGGADEDFDAYDIERGMMMRLPPGAKMNQFKGEHPGTTYEMFVWCLLREICRCLGVPLNVALGDSSKSNFSSARLDHLVYWEGVDVEREDMAREVLEPVFAEWYREARLAGLLPEGTPADASALPHRWEWPSRPVIDPKTEAESDEIRLRSGTATHAEIAGAQGRDWRERIRQRVMEEVYEAHVRDALGAPPKQAATEGVPTNAA